MRVLLTGANGFIGSHILQLFLDRSIFVQAVVRSEAKASRVRKDFPGFDSSKLDFSILPDITTPGAFDQCLKDAQPLDAIIHTASPFNYSTAKVATDFIDPAVRGTTEIIESAAKYSPGLKRFVITSSFAAIGNPEDLQGNGRGVLVRRMESPPEGANTHHGFEVGLLGEQNICRASSLGVHENPQAEF